MLLPCLYHWSLESYILVLFDCFCYLLGFIVSCCAFDASKTQTDLMLRFRCPFLKPLGTHLLQNSHGRWSRPLSLVTPTVPDADGLWTFELTLEAAAGVQVDRVVVREDVRKGQRIRSFTIDTRGPAARAGAWAEGAANGTSVGNRKVAFLRQGATAVGSVRLRVATVGRLAPVLLAFDAFPQCPDG